MNEQEIQSMSGDDVTYTPITENVETDNSTQEPDTSDNSKSVEPKDTNTAGTEVKEDHYKKNFGEDVEPDKVNKYLKKTYGDDVKIEDLTERELKALKSGFNAEKAMHKTAQELSEHQKKIATETLVNQRTGIDTESSQLRQEYDRNMATVSATNKAAHLKAFQEQLVDMVDANGNQIYSAAQIIGFTAEHSIKLDNQFKYWENKFNSDFQTAQKSIHDKQNSYIESTYKNLETEFSKEFENEPELKELFNDYKQEFPNDNGNFKKFVLPQFKKMIESRDKRIAAVKGQNKAINSNSQKQTTPSGESKNIPLTNDREKKLFDLIMKNT